MRASASPANIPVTRTAAAHLRISVSTPSPPISVSPLLRRRGGGLSPYPRCYAATPATPMPAPLRAFCNKIRLRPATGARLASIVLHEPRAPPLVVGTPVIPCPPHPAPEAQPRTLVETIRQFHDSPRTEEAYVHVSVRLARRCARASPRPRGAARRGGARPRRSHPWRQPSAVGPRDSARQRRPPPVRRATSPRRSRCGPRTAWSVLPDRVPDIGSLSGTRYQPGTGYRLDIVLYPVPGTGSDTEASAPAESRLVVDCWHRSMVH